MTVKDKNKELYEINKQLNSDLEQVVDESKLMNTKITELQLVTKQMHAEVMVTRTRYSDIVKTANSLSKLNFDLNQELQVYKNENMDLIKEMNDLKETVRAQSRVATNGSLSSDLQRVAQMRGNAEELFRACLSYSARIGQLEADLEEAAGRENNFEELQETVLKEVDIKDHRIQRLEKIIARYRHEEKMRKEELPNGGKADTANISNKQNSGHRLSESSLASLHQNPDHYLKSSNSDEKSDSLSPNRNYSQAQIESRIKGEHRQFKHLQVDEKTQLSPKKMLPIKEAQHQPRESKNTSIFSRDYGGDDQARRVALSRYFGEDALQKQHERSINPMIEVSKRDKFKKPK